MKVGRSVLRCSVLGISLLAAPFFARLNAQDGNDFKWNKRSGDGVKGRAGKGNDSERFKRRYNASNQQQGMLKRLNLFLSSLSEEEREKLKNLRKEDPQKFREALREKMKEVHSKKQEQAKKIRDLVSSYKKAESQEEKTEILQRLREETEKEFREKMEINLRRLEESEQKVKKFREKYEMRKKMAKEIIDERVKDLTRDQNLKW